LEKIACMYCIVMHFTGQDSARFELPVTLKPIWFVYKQRCENNHRTIKSLMCPTVTRLCTLLNSHFFLLWVRHFGTSIDLTNSCNRYCYLRKLTHVQVRTSTWSTLKRW